MSRDPVLTARSRVALATRHGNAEALTEARRDLNAAHVERAIARALAAAPPLTDDQRHRLSALLVGGAR